MTVTANPAASRLAMTGAPCRRRMPASVTRAARRPPTTARRRSPTLPRAPASTTMEYDKAPRLTETFMRESSRRGGGSGGYGTTGTRGRGELRRTPAHLGHARDEPAGTVYLEGVTIAVVSRRTIDGVMNTTSSVEVLRSPRCLKSQPRTGISWNIGTPRLAVSDSLLVTPPITRRSPSLMRTCVSALRLLMDGG